jgi:SET domain-containing protein
VPQAEDALPPTTVSTSRIAGRGLFAGAPIDAGRVVLVLGEEDVRTRVNHSCEPNLGWADDRTLIAVRDIAEGDELTVDYATRISDPTFMMVCHCETYRCRQVVEGTDWQIPQLQRRYAGRWAPEVQHLIDAASG